MLTLAVACCTAFFAACSREEAGPSGSVHVSTQTKVSAAVQAGTTTANSICARFTLIAYSFDSQGKPVQADAPVTFTTSSSSNATDAVLGCLSGTPDTYSYVAPPGSDYATGMYNWAYLVSASDFVYCDGTPLTASTAVSAAPAYFAPVECSAGVDTLLQINYPIALSTSDPAGYIDISASVNPTDVSLGCKIADAQIDGIHFGEIGFYTPNLPANDTNAPLGFTAIGGLATDRATASAPTPADVDQWDGILTDAATAQRASFYTGIFALPSAATQTSGGWDLIQTFAQSCPAGVYAATQVPLCETTIDTSGNAPAVSTETLLADVIEIGPNAIVSGQQDWLIAYSEANPSTHQLSEISIRSGIGDTISNPYPTASAGWNAETLHQTLDLATLPGGPFIINGLFVDPETPFGLVVVFSDASAAYSVQIGIDPEQGVWELQPQTPLQLLTDDSYLAALFGPITPGCQSSGSTL